MNTIKEFLATILLMIEYVFYWLFVDIPKKLWRFIKRQ